MIPIRDVNPTRRVPWMTMLIIAANVAVFLYETNLPVPELDRFVSAWGLVPARLFPAPSLASALTVITSMFIHGGWMHIIGNMLYLWIFGNNVEDRIGSLGFAVFYLASGIVASLTQVIVTGPSLVPQIGASGAVAGVLGAYLVMFPASTVVTLIPIFFVVEVAHLPAYLVIGFWFLAQLGNGLASLGVQTGSTGGVAWFAHIGGFLVGVPIAIAFRAWERTRRRRPYRGSWG